jgi:predicted HTH domain antitoxin
MLERFGRHTTGNCGEIPQRGDAVVFLSHCYKEPICMSQIAFDVPPEILIQLGADDEQAHMELRMMAAVKLYELGRLSSGAAATLADVPKPVFLQHLARYGVATFDLSAEELRKEMANA